MKKTEDAEITAAMPIQRVREAEIRARNKSSNGPRRARANSLSVVRDGRPTSAVGDMMVSRKGHPARDEARWHRGSLIRP